MMEIDSVPGGRLRAAESPGTTRKRWPADWTQEFRIWAPCAVVMVGTEGPLSVTVLEAGGQVVKQRFGHNRGVWPLRLARSGAWKDTVTLSWDRSPFVATGALFRVWCETDAHASRLAGLCGELLGRMSEAVMGAELRHGFVDVGPDLQPAMLEMEVHALAGRLGFQAWDDDGLERELERRVRARDPMSGR